jgi:hypothetical protein
MRNSYNLNLIKKRLKNIFFKNIVLTFNTLNTYLIQFRKDKVINNSFFVSSLLLQKKRTGISPVL